MPGPGCFSDVEVEAFLLGDLSERVSRAVSDHLEACARCAALADRLDALTDLKKHGQWKKDIAELAKRKNVVGKVSGVVAQSAPGKWTAGDLAPVVKHTMAVFGPDRVMFGGDWPVCLLAATYAQWVKALKEIVADRKVDEQRKLFHDNAVKFYGLAAKT